jgi:hypothetical protein
MAERRKVRSGTGRSTREEPADRDEQEMLDEDELLDESEEADEPEEPEDADEDEAPDGGQRRQAGRRGGSSMTAGEAAKAALREIAQLTAKQPEGITGVERTDDGWTVGIELVEDQRIPSSADILATYEATIDGDGDLVSYRRVRRYARGHADSEDL